MIVTMTGTGKAAMATAIIMAVAAIIAVVTIMAAAIIVAKSKVFLMTRPSNKQGNISIKNFINLKSGSGLFLLLILILTGVRLFHAAKPLDHNDKLTPELLRKAYIRYSVYHESSMDLNQYSQSFPTQNYSLYKVKDSGSFFLENKPDAIKSELREGRRWEPYLIPYMTQYVKKNSNVLDIGAHIGTHTIYFAKLLAGQGTVWAFEPQQKLFMELNANLFINDVHHVKTLRYAVGKQKGIIQMSPTIEGNEGHTAVGRGGDKADLVSIDSLGIKNVSFIKIDVEGYEDFVLAGAAQTIKTSKPVILCEIMGGAPFETASPAVQMKILRSIAKLKGFGYRVTRVHESDYLAVPL